jgi:lysophospholipase L1-like esterase
MVHILIFGASITYGAWDIEGGWVQRLRKYLNRDLDWRGRKFYLTYNLGISGDTTKELLERFEFETRQRTKSNREKIIMISIGMSDSSIKNDRNFVEIKEFEENLKKLFEKAKKYTDNIIFVGLTPVDEAKTNPISWNEEMFFKNTEIKKYSGKAKEICEKNKILFIELFDKLINKNSGEILKDGLHPNSEGHKMIYEIVKEFLIKNKII